MILANIDEAVASGASQAAACELLGLDERTVQRWRARPDGVDQRRGPTARPSNSLTTEEETEILMLVTSKEFVGLSPHQLVAKLADMDIYLASEATIYRLLRRNRLLIGAGQEWIHSRRCGGSSPVDAHPGSELVHAPRGARTRSASAQRASQAASQPASHRERAQKGSASEAWSAAIVASR